MAGSAAIPVITRARTIVRKAIRFIFNLLLDQNKRFIYMDAQFIVHLLYLIWAVILMGKTLQSAIALPYNF